MNFNEAIEKVEQMNQLEKNMLLTTMINQTTLSEKEKRCVFDKIFKDRNLNPRKVYN